MGSYDSKIFEKRLKLISEQTSAGDISDAVKTYAELKKEYSVILASSEGFAAKQSYYGKILKAYRELIDAKQKVGTVSKAETAKEETLLLHEAISDITKQITSVSYEETLSENQIRETKGKISKIHHQEKGLRSSLSSLAAQESYLNSRRLGAVERASHLRIKKKEMEKIVQALKDT